MYQEIEVDFDTKTDGKGYWSDVARHVKIIELGIDDYDSNGDFGELYVVFDGLTWNVDAYGLIYTDNLWLYSLKQVLKARGFSDAAIDEVDYSEQGMQGNDYVSLDVGPTFLAEWKRLNPK